MAEGVEAAFEAVRSGDVDGLRALLAVDAGLVSARGTAGVTLLHVAAEQDDSQAAELLLDHGVETDAVADWGQTALEWAANVGSDGVAELLIERGAGRHGLWTAAALGRLYEVESTFSGGRVNEGVGRTPGPGADLSKWPLETAFRRGEVVSDAFYIACRRGRLEVARFLLARGADVNARGYFGASALHWAAAEGQEGVVRWLLEQGAEVAESDPHFGSTPAAWAHEGGHHEIERLLTTAAESAGDIPE